MLQVASILLLLAHFSVVAFRPCSRVNSKLIRLNALEPHVVEKLQEIRDKYERLEHVVSPEAVTENSKMKELAEKFGTYLEVKKMMTRFRSMYKNEASDQRKARQLRSFISLYKQKSELEDILLRDGGFSPSSTTKSSSLVELEAINRHIAELDKTLEKVAVKFPPGKLTRLERASNTPT
jgi:hypothetical protein